MMSHAWPGIVCVAYPRSHGPLRRCVPSDELRTNTPHARRRIICASSSAGYAFNGNGNAAAPGSSGALSKWDQWWSAIPSSNNKPDSVSVLSALQEVVKLISRTDAIWLAIASVLLVSGALCELAVPHFVAQAFQAVIAAANDGSAAPLLDRFSISNCLAVLATCPLLVSALKWNVLVNLGEAVFNACRSACLGILGHRLVGKLRRKVFGSMITQEVMFFATEENNAAALSSRLTSDCLAVTKLLTLNLNVMMRQGLQAIGGLIYLIYLNVPLGIGCCVSTALMATISVRYGTLARRAVAAMQDALAESTASAQESLSSIRLVRSLGYEETEQRRYSWKLQSVIDIGIRFTTAYAAYLFSSTNVWYLARLFVLGVGGAYTLSGTLTPAQLTAFVMYVDHVLSSCLAVCEQFASVLESVGATSTVLGLLKLEAAPQVSSGYCPRESAFKRGIVFQNVTYAYPTRPGPALRNVSLELPPGSSTAIVGRSGSGKSTLVQLLTRQADPDSGHISVGGHDLRIIDSAWYRQHLSVVPQDPRLFSTSVYDNIAYGMEGGISIESVKEAARAANAQDFIEKLPQGYATFVTDGLLSGGQRQRIAIARAIVRNPRVMVLDEATSALDAESEGAVQAALQDIMDDRSRTVVVVSHRLSTVRKCDQIIVLDAGIVAEVGTHSQLMRKRRGIYRDLVEQQSRGADVFPVGLTESYDDASKPARPSAGRSNGSSRDEEVIGSKDDMAMSALRDKSQE